MDTTLPTTVTEISKRYDGKTTVFHWDTGDWTEYDVNADNPDRRWVLSIRGTIYGGRAVCDSTRDVLEQPHRGPDVTVPITHPDYRKQADARLAGRYAERTFAKAQVQAVLWYVTLFARVGV